MPSTIFAKVLTLGSSVPFLMPPMVRGATLVQRAKASSLRPEEMAHWRTEARAMRTGLDIGSDYAQTVARRKRQSRTTMEMTRAGRRGTSRRMPLRSKEATAAYDIERVRAGLEAVRAEIGLTPRQWAIKAGVHPNSLYTFLDMQDPDAKPNAKPKKESRRTETPYITFFVRLAWAAGVSVSRLIGDPLVEAGPVLSISPPEAPPQGESEAQVLLALLARKEEELARLRRTLYDLQIRVADLERASQPKR